MAKSKYFGQLPGRRIIWINNFSRITFVTQTRNTIDINCAQFNKKRQYK